MNNPVTIRIPTPLRDFTEGANQVAVDGATVLDALTALERAHDGVLTRVLTSDGRVRQFVNLYVGERDVRTLQGLATPLAAGDVLAIIPAVAGGLEATGGRR